MILVPEHEKLDAIKAQGYSGSVLSKMVGPYHLSVIYRQCSAMGASDMWYPESAIWNGKEWCFQGEGWASFIHLANNLNTVEEVEHFLAVMNEPDND